MTKRQSQATLALAEPEYEQPQTKRHKAADTADFKPAPCSSSLMKMLREVATAEVTDDDASATSETRSRTRALRQVPSASQSQLSQPVNTSVNYCHTGRPLACPPILSGKKLQAKFVLKEINSTLL